MASPFFGHLYAFIKFSFAMTEMIEVPSRPPQTSWVCLSFVLLEYFSNLYSSFSGGWGLLDQLEVVCVKSFSKETPGI